MFKKTGNFSKFRNSEDRGPREMFDATCDKCGRECKVPFRPNGTKPIFCSDCFEKNGGNENKRSFDNQRPSFGPRREFEPRNNGGSELREISQKLDKVLDYLSRMDSLNSR